MSTFVAFLRAINIGKRQVKMADLRKCLQDNGFADVETYIQTGNVRFTSAATKAADAERELERVVQTQFGFHVDVIVRTPRQLAAVGRTGSTLEPKLTSFQRRYVTFLSVKPSTAVATQLAAWDAPGEEVKVVGREIYVWLDKTSQEAKWSNMAMEKYTGLATTRDWKVVAALAERWG